MVWSQLADTLPLAFLLLDAQHSILLASRQAGDLWGLSPSHLVGMSLREFFTRAGHPNLYQTIAGLLREKQPGPLRFLLQDRQKWIAVTAAATAAGSQLSFSDITQQVESQQQATQLAAENRRLQQLLETASRMEAEAQTARRRLEEAQQIGHIGSFEWNCESDATYWSDELYRIYGLKPQHQAMSLNQVLNYTHPEDRQWLEEEIRKSRQQVRTVRLSHRIIRADGEVRFLNRQFESLADARGHIRFIRGTVQDITDQKRTDLILDAINEVCFELDENFNFIYANRKAFTSWKKTAAEVLGRPIWEVFPEIRSTPLEEALVRAATTKAQVLQEVYCPVPHSWIFLNANPSPAGLIVLHFDITEQVEARRRLSEQQARYQALVENIPDMVTRWDRDLKLVYANSAFEVRTGQPIASMAGRTYLEMGLPEDFAQLWMEKLNQVLATGQAQSHYYALPTPAGTAYFFSRIVPERAPDGSVHTALAIARDITDLKKAEAEVLSGKIQLQSVLNASANAIALLRAVRNEQHQLTDFEWVVTNPAFVNLMGQQTVDQPYFSHSSLARQAGLLQALKAVAENGRMWEEEIHCCQQELDKWLHLIAVKTGDGVVVTLGDITLRKRQEEAIAKHLHILQQSEELARTGSWEYDVASGAFQWSEGMYRLFGLAPGTPVQPEIYRHYAQEKDLPRAEALIRRLRQDQQPFEETLHLKVGGRRKTFRIKAVVVPDPQGRPAQVLGVDLDITEVQKLEKENLAIRLQQQKNLILAILEAQENERKRIAEGLHNSLAQLLYAARLHLEQLGREPARQADYRLQVDQLLDEAIRETRRISHELMPAILEEMGLAAAIEDICHKFSTPQLDLHCRVYPLSRRLPKHLQLAIYRMVQELTNNIVKHAGATRASIQISQQDRHIALLAEDDGIGFTRKPGQATGIGLKVIQDRVSLLGGTMEMDSQPGKGTLISIYLPAPPPRRPPRRR